MQWPVIFLESRAAPEPWAVTYGPLLLGAITTVVGVVTGVVGILLYRVTRKQAAISEGQATTMQEQVRTSSGQTEIMAEQVTISTEQARIAAAQFDLAEQANRARRAMVDNSVQVRILHIRGELLTVLRLSPLHILRVTVDTPTMKRYDLSGMLRWRDDAEAFIDRTMRAMHETRALAVEASPDVLASVTKAYATLHQAAAHLAESKRDVTEPADFWMNAKFMFTALQALDGHLYDALSTELRSLPGTPRKAVISQNLMNVW